MKPNFALDLSHTGIRLLELARGGEVALGAVSLDDPDFDARIAELRDRARQAAKGPVRTELIIPPSEILYTEIAAPGADRTERAQAVRAGLAGATPYALDELVFDWRAAKDRALVAAVARVTLEEARDFALRHGFNPVRYGARPQEGQFRGRPDFGPVAGTGPGVADDPAAVAAPVSAASDDDPQAEPAPPTRVPGTDAGEAAPEAPTAAPAKTPVAEEARTPAAGSVAAAEGPSDGDDDVEEVQAAAEAAPDSTTQVPALAGKNPLASAGPGRTTHATPAAPQSEAADTDAPAPPRMHLAVPAAPPQVAAVDDVPAPLATSHPAARGWPLTRAGDEGPDEAPEDGADTALPFASRRGRDDRVATAAVPPAAAAPKAGPAAAFAVKTDAARPAEQEPAQAQVAPVPADARRKKVLAPPVAGPGARRMAAGRGLAEAEALTVFGARPAKGTPRRNWGRAGGLATAAAALAALIWGAYFLIGDPASEIAPMMTGTASSLAAPPAETDAPARVAEPARQGDPQAAPPAVAAPQPAPAASARAAVPTGTEGAARAEDGPQSPPAAAPADPVPPAPAQAAPALPAPLTPDQATARYAATGIWQLSPLPPQAPQGDRVDGLYTAALDPEIAQPPAADLPHPARDRLALAAPQQPVGGGDAAEAGGPGRAKANAALAAANGGVRIIDGPPPAIPPAPPSRADATPQDQPATADGVPANANAVAEAFRPGPDMPRTRPLPRPAALAPGQSGAAEPDPATPPAAATAEAPPVAEPAPQVALAGAETIRPLARPATAAAEPALKDRAQAAAIAAAAASALASAPDSVDEAGDAEPEPDQISPYAVASSVAPRSRPGDLATSRRSAPAQVAAPSSVVTPPAPTSASVARKATDGNALNLGRMNLIGVYGTATNRRALLRLPSGKFVKVKVGDQVDGGRIAAIGAADLRYVKRGQNITLSMPRS